MTVFLDGWTCGCGPYMFEHPSPWSREEIAKRRRLCPDCHQPVVIIQSRAARVAQEGTKP